jgi:tetrapyrrole methylase family protein/MazG family protein
VENSKLNQTYAILDELLRLVETLRGEKGCPWDRKQTPQSVSVYLIEEVFELADAIQNGNPEQIREELGDVLFHIVFIARMFQERDEFNLFDVAQSITEKMIRRHPHVFGEKRVASSEEVIENWHKIKLGENKASKVQSLLDSIPAQLPALIRAYRISDRVAKSGFEWVKVDEDVKNAEKVLGGVKRAAIEQNHVISSRTYGDLLFVLVNIARLAKIHPETALAESTKRFERRFKKLEGLVSESEGRLGDISEEEKMVLWEKVKKLFP